MKVVICLILTVFLFGCKVETPGVNIHIHNNGNKKVSVELYVTEKKIRSNIALEPMETEVIFLPSIDILNALESQQFSTGDLTLVTNGNGKEYEICGYIDAIVSDVCGENDFYLSID